jgi:tetratricopeptide (TPR) repeat protein
MSKERSEVYYNRGLSKARTGDTKSAIEDYNKAIALNPTYHEAYFTRGMIKSQMGDQRGAIQDCTNAIKLNNKYAEAYYVRGIIRHALGDTDGCNDLSKSGELGYTPAYGVIKDYCN